MPSNLRAPYLAASHVHALPSHLPLGELGLLPVNAYLIDGRQPILVDTGLAIDRGDFESTLWSLVDPMDLLWVVITHDDRDHCGNLKEVLMAAPNAIDADQTGYLAGMAMFTRANAPWTALADQRKWDRALAEFDVMSTASTSRSSSGNHGSMAQCSPGTRPHLAHAPIIERRDLRLPATDRRAHPCLERTT